MLVVILAVIVLGGGAVAAVLLTRGGEKVATSAAQKTTTAAPTSTTTRAATTTTASPAGHADVLWVGTWQTTGSTGSTGLQLMTVMTGGTRGTVEASDPEYASEGTGRIGTGVVEVDESGVNMRVTLTSLMNDDREILVLEGVIERKAGLITFQGVYTYPRAPADDPSNSGRFYLMQD